MHCKTLSRALEAFASLVALRKVAQIEEVHMSVQNNVRMVETHGFARPRGLSGPYKHLTCIVEHGFERWIHFLPL